MQTTSTLVTILLLTQITELKLLLELNSDHHRFYHLVLSALIVCIAAEVLLGVVTVYVARDRFNRPLCQLSNNMTNEFFSIPNTKHYPTPEMKEAGVRLLSLHSPADPAQDTAARTLSAIEGRRHSLDGGDVSSAPSTARSKEQSAAAIGASIQAAKEEADWLDKNRLGMFLDMPAEHQLASIQRIALWQNVVSYLLHFVMILNILITAFGITGNQRRP